MQIATYPKTTTKGNKSIHAGPALTVDAELKAIEATLRTLLRAIEMHERAPSATISARNSGSTQ